MSGFLSAFCARRGGGQNEIVWIIRGEGQAKAKEGQMPTPPLPPLKETLHVVLLAMHVTSNLCHDFRLVDQNKRVS